MTNIRSVSSTAPQLTLAVIILLSCCYFVFYGCGSDSIPQATVESKAQDTRAKIAREDTVIFDYDGGPIPDPHNLNPLVPSPTGPGMRQCVWEPLFSLNYETGEIAPWMGESFTPNEGLDAWTLKIRAGVKWSDGEDFDAEDVIFTLNTLLNDTTQSLSDAASMQQWVKQVERVDSLTVRFDLKAPNPRFKLDYFSVRVGSSMVILPQHIWVEKDPFTFKFYDPEKGWPIGTGAYQLITATENEFTFRRRKDWWGAEVGFRDLPVPEQLVWMVTGVEENRALLAADNQLDSIMDITLGAFESIRFRNPNLIAWKDEMPYVWLDPCPRQLSVNHTVPPWDNPQMRKALSSIIDRQQVVKIAYEDTSFPSKTIFVEYPAMQPYINAVKDLWIDPNSDVPTGQSLIEANGWRLNNSGFYEKAGKELALSIQTHEAYIEKRRIAEVVVEQLRAAGIDASTRAIAGATWNDNKAFGNFEAVMDWDACGSVNEPWLSMNRYTQQFLRLVDQRSPGNNNYVRWSGAEAEEYSQIVAKIGVLPLGDPGIEPLVAEAMKIFMTEQVVIPITQARKLIPFVTTYWEGWPTAKDNNYHHPPTWWMSTHQIIQRLRKAQR